VDQGMPICVAISLVAQWVHDGLYAYSSP